uniref:mRNA m(6)A methyltransferase n=1 Tax=Sciurus vulgaris TaxID=55149 RepID=A0A8D2DDH0_SCIVU
MSDTWSSIQAHKKQLDSLQERLQWRRKQDSGNHKQDLRNPEAALSPNFHSDSPVPTAPTSGGPKPSTASAVPELATDPELEKKLLHHLSDLTLTLPTDAVSICLAISRQMPLPLKMGWKLLQDDAHPTLVTYADHSKLSAMTAAGAEKKGPGEVAGTIAGQKQRAEQDSTTVAAFASSLASGLTSSASEPAKESAKKSRKHAASDVDLEIESLLNQQSTKEQQSKKGQSGDPRTIKYYNSRAQVQEFCDYGTKEECMKASDTDRPCSKLHFRRIINKHTDESLGDCSFLNTCFYMDTCKYVHYEIDACVDPEGPGSKDHRPSQELALTQSVGGDSSADRLFPPPWICCDICYLDVSMLGKFAVVMADPPWDIHMELPYGTLTDDEMRRLNIPVLQDDGFLFLWVTGRAMELGRECLNHCGYERVDEIIRVKTNQLQRIIRTGHTGLWLNHGKEHCLVGVKGNPQGFNQGLDYDVIVAEVRSTSHKPDEIYGMIERLSPGTRKIELFGRPHNVQPNWITLGDQLDGIHLLDPDVVARFKQRYPDGIISKPKNL